jgi:threonine synthase
VRYVSTRGEAPPLGFMDVTLAGLARDGGLYVPETWPRLSPQTIAGFACRPYAEVAVEVIRPFVGDSISEADLSRLAREAYGTFRHPAVAPLAQFGASTFLLELFHGPTLAFKDVAMQLLARLMDHALAARGERTTIVVATSGDTGGAAVEAFRGRERADLFVLFPHGRVSDVQRRMMTTANDNNVHALAVEGTFDDCQAILKALFNDESLRDQLSLTGVNSINFARILAQTVYYFTSAVALGSPHRAVSFAVPTGNFGDIFAGYAARKMGLPVKRLVIATNLNDSLARALATGIYEPRGVIATSSPSMDIQLASNFERLLFELAARDGARVRARMDELRAKGAFHLEEGELAEMRVLFAAHSTGEHETEMTIRGLFAETGVMIDPHTAVGLAAARAERVDTPMIVLSTAHAAKFPQAIERALGRLPEQPERLKAKLGQEERLTVLANDYASIAHFIASHARAKTDGRKAANKARTGVGA